MNVAERQSFWAKAYRYRLHHVLFWAGYFLFWILFYRPYYPSLGPLIFVTSIYFIFNALAFYTTAYYLFPKFLYQNRYSAFFQRFGALVVVLSLALAISLQFIFNGYSRSEGPVSFAAVLQIAFLSITTMLGLMSAMKLVADKIRSDRTNRLLDRQRLESELQYLKAQVNPHFLFNAINSVYFLIRKDPEQAADTLIKLSDLLRFQLYDCSEEKIAIEKELEYLNNFIALEKVRKGDKLRVDQRHEGTLSGFRIAPFLLIPFVENAFKHVSNDGSRENRVDIRFHRAEGQFSAEIVNTTGAAISNNVGGIGLKNVKRRLELLYPGRHELRIVEAEGLYRVQLSLTIA